MLQCGLLCLGFIKHQSNSLSSSRSATVRFFSTWPRSPPLSRLQRGVQACNVPRASLLSGLRQCGPSHHPRRPSPFPATSGQFLRLSAPQLPPDWLQRMVILTRPQEPLTLWTDLSGRPVFREVFPIDSGLRLRSGRGWACTFATFTVIVAETASPFVLAICFPLIAISLLSTLSFRFWFSPVLLSRFGPFVPQNCEPSFLIQNLSLPWFSISGSLVAYPSTRCLDRTMSVRCWVAETRVSTSRILSANTSSVNNRTPSYLVSKPWRSSPRKVTSIRSEKSRMDSWVPRHPESMRRSCTRSVCHVRIGPPFESAALPGGSFSWSSSSGYFSGVAAMLASSVWKFG